MLGGVEIRVEILNQSCYCLKFLKSESESVSRVRLFATPWAVAHQAPLSMEFSRQEVDSHFLLQGIFPTQGMNLGLLNCRQIVYHLSHQGSLASIYF